MKVARLVLVAAASDDCIVIVFHPVLFSGLLRQGVLGYETQRENLSEYIFISDYGEVF